jgi:hypothetical protein
MRTRTDDTFGDTVSAKFVKCEPSGTCPSLHSHIRSHSPMRVRQRKGFQTLDPAKSPIELVIKWDRHVEFQCPLSLPATRKFLNFLLNQI